MTIGFLVAVFLVVLQFAYAVHVRSTLTLAAAEGARAGARVGSSDAEAVMRTRDFISGSLNASYASGVSAHRTGAHGVVTVDVAAPIPVLGPFGIGLTMKTSARAVEETRE